MGKEGNRAIRTVETNGMTNLCGRSRVGQPANLVVPPGYELPTQQLRPRVLKEAMCREARHISGGKETQC